MRVPGNTLADAGTRAIPRARLAAGYSLVLMTVIYALNIADRFVGSTLIEPIKSEFGLSDASVAFLTGVGLAIFYTTAAIPLGALADRVSRKAIIIGSLLGWSVTTAVCGLTRSYMQLLVARIGVGIGEAGATPAQVSLLAEHFPARARATAMSIFALGAGIGSMIGATVGGWLSDHYGWRVTLMSFGAMGVPLALLVYFTIREPARGTFDRACRSEATSLAETLAFIWKEKTLFHVVAAATVVTFWGWGLVWWTPAFLTRSHHLTVGQAGALLGPMHGVGGTAVMIATAVAMAWLARASIARQVWFLAITTLLAVIPSVFVYATPSLRTTTLALWCFVPLTYLYIGPTIALGQNLAPSGMRAKVAAVLLFTTNVANLVVAPQLIGFASDVLRPHVANPQDSLRYVLLFVTFTGIWGAIHYAWASRSIQRGVL